MNQKDKCSTKNCRGESCLIHLDNPLCWSCWEKLCEQVKK